MTLPEMDSEELYRAMCLFRLELADMSPILMLNLKNIRRHKQQPPQVNDLFGRTDVQNMQRWLQDLTRDNPTPYMKEREQNYRNFVEHLLPHCAEYVQPPLSTQKEREMNF